VSRTKGFNVVIEGSLVLEVRTTGAEPALATILLVGSPVTFHGQELPTLATRKRLHPARASSCNGFATFGSLSEASLSDGLCCSCTLLRNSSVVLQIIRNNVNAPKKRY
jgi:hypothetical protein